MTNHIYWESLYWDGLDPLKLNAIPFSSDITTILDENSFENKQEWQLYLKLFQSANAFLIERNLIAENYHISICDGEKHSSRIVF